MITICWRLDKTKSSMIQKEERNFQPKQRMNIKKGEMALLLKQKGIGLGENYEKKKIVFMSDFDCMVSHRVSENARSTDCKRKREGQHCTV